MSDDDPTIVDHALEKRERHSVWRPRRPLGLAARRALWRQRLLLTFAALAACVVLGILLYAPFRHPNLQIVILPTLRSDSPAFEITSDGGLSRFADGDRAAVASLAPVTPTRAVVEITVPRMASDFEALPNRLPTGEDVLILYLQTSVDDLGGEPGFRCDFGSSRPADNFLPVSRFLQILSERDDLGRSALLLVIDQGQADVSGVNAFPLLIEDAVRATRNPRLWVLCSNSPLESSEQLWSRRRSVFADAVTRALAGDADLDDDRDIDLFELARYVGSRVTTTVDALSNGQSSQTPILCWGGGDIPDINPPVLAPVTSSGLPDESAAPRAFGVSLNAAGSDPAPIAASPPTDAVDSDDAAAETLQPPEKLAELVARGWQLRDEIESGPLNPMAYAPREWRAYTDALQRVEALVWADAGTPALVVEMDNSLAALAAARDGAESPWPVPAAIQPLVDAVRIRAKPPQIDTASLVVAVWLADHGGTALPEETAAAWQAYTAALEADDAGSFQTWLTSAPAELFTWDEFVFARELAPALSADWPLLRRVLKIHITAGQTALHFERAPMFREPMHQGDQARISAEQLLLDAVDPQRAARAHRLLDEAELQYTEARRAAELLADVRACYVRQSFLVPEYCRWWAESGALASRFGPAEDDLRALIRQLSELSTLLSDPAPQDGPRLQSGLQNLKSLGQRICSDVCAHTVSPSRDVGVGPETSWQMETLLDTSLPRGDVRQSLLESIVGAEQATLSSLPRPAAAWPLPRRTLSVSDWLFQVAEAQLRAELTALAAVDVPGAVDHLDRLRAALRLLQAEDVIAGGRVSMTLALERHQAFAAELQRLTASVLRGVDSSPTPQHDNGTGVGQVLTAIERSLQCDRVLGRVTERVVSADPGQFSRWELAEWLAWSAARLETRAWDLDARVADQRHERAKFYRQQSRTLLGSAATASASPSLQIAAPAAINLYEPERRVDLSFNATTSGETPAWIVVDYNPQLVSITPPPGVSLYRQPDLADRNGALQLDPLMNEQPPSLMLKRGANLLSLHVTRLATVADPAKLIVKVATHRDRARSVVSIDLPTPQFAAVEITGRTGSWSEDDTALVLHPYPNQSTAYQLRLRNLTDVGRTVDVRLMALESPTPLTLPPGVVSGEAASEILNRIPGLKAVGILANQKLAPLSGPATNDAPAEEPADPPPPVSLQHGAVLAIVDKESGQTSLKMVQVQPQHPRRYLRPQVSYDLERERVQIIIRAEDPAVLPESGSGVSAEFSVALTGARQLDGAILAGRNETRLFADIPTAPGKTVDVWLHVDAYPRAFLYRVPCDRPVSFVPESLDALHVDIVAPLAGRAYQTPTAAIPVSLRVDAPVGAFRNPATLGEIGFDLNRDRFLINEPAVRLTSDRSVVVSAQPLTPAGRLVLQTMVTDHELTLPATGLRNARVNLQARLQVGDDTAWSRPVEIVLDSTPPNISDVIMQPGRIVAAAEMLQVVVSAEDGDGSGVARVELAFDVANTGEFTEESAVIPATRSPAGAWTATLPLADLAPGSHGLLIRAVDRTDNVGAARRESLTVLSEEDAAARAIALTAPITGSARYGDRPIPNASISLLSAEGEELTSTLANSDGEFQLPKVAPGDYTLVAEGLIRNKVRRAEAAVTVPPGPAVVEPIPLQLR